jgi:hypothetical protein
MFTVSLLAINIYFGFTISALGCHVTILSYPQARGDIIEVLYMCTCVIRQRSFATKTGIMMKNLVSVKSYLRYDSFILFSFLHRVKYEGNREKERGDTIVSALVLCESMHFQNTS